ncbi:MAG: hypothetical protein ABW068_04560, partial [Candidatus Thiodiazotropha sp.]
WLQRRFDALLQAGTLRLNMAYLGAGLIIDPNTTDRKTGIYYDELPVRFCDWLPPPSSSEPLPGAPCAGDSTTQ